MMGDLQTRVKKMEEPGSAIVWLKWLSLKTTCMAALHIPFPVHMIRGSLNLYLEQIYPFNKVTLIAG